MQQYVQAPHPEQQAQQQAQHQAPQQQQGGPGGPGDVADAPARRPAPGDGLRRFETPAPSARNAADLVELDAPPAAHRAAAPAPSASADLLGQG